MPAGGTLFAHGYRTLRRPIHRDRCARRAARHGGRVRRRDVDAAARSCRPARSWQPTGCRSPAPPTSGTPPASTRQIANQGSEPSGFSCQVIAYGDTAATFSDGAPTNELTLGPNESAHIGTIVTAHGRRGAGRAARAVRAGPDLELERPVAHRADSPADVQHPVVAVARDLHVQERGPSGLLSLRDQRRVREGPPVRGSRDTRRAAPRPTPSPDPPRSSGTGRTSARRCRHRR